MNFACRALLIRPHSVLVWGFNSLFSVCVREGEGDGQTFKTVTTVFGMSFLCTNEALTLASFITLNESKYQDRWRFLGIRKNGENGNSSSMKHASVPPKCRIEHLSIVSIDWVQHSVEWSEKVMTNNYAIIYQLFRDFKKAWKRRKGILWLAQMSSLEASIPASCYLSFSSIDSVVIKASQSILCVKNLQTRLV